jgi:c-di-GMP-binding flagellar brake protein YcgR
MENASLITEILYPGKSVQIEIVNNYNNKIITKTTVCIIEADDLILDLPKKEGTFNQVSAGSDIVVVCKHKEEPQDHVFFTKFIMVKDTDPPNVVLNKPIEFALGRHAIRYDVNIPFSYIMDNKEIKEGTVANLSCFGLLAIIKPNNRVEREKELHFKLFLPSSPPLTIVGKIMRITKLEKEYKIALYFPYIFSEIANQIIKYLFSCQTTMAKKEKQQKTAFIKIS